MTPSQSSETQSTLLWYYILCGFLHEASHLLAGLALGAQLENSWTETAAEAILFRQVHFDSRNVDDESIIRHVGWIASAFVLCFICFSGHPSPSAKLAAGITLIEAITTDLFQLGTLLPLNFSSHSSPSVFLCGNFGIILLHHMWLKDNCSNALDCLEKMVQVTMMRGAQTGGFCTFRPIGASGDLQGIRSRVVNRKRTDLSKLIRSRAQKVIRVHKPPKDFVTVLSGHTRFATSSKATMDGTHPHQWTPPSYRRVYNTTWSSGTPPRARKVKVENYITHNGDFDFYVVNGKTYELESVQRWLVKVTGCDMPAIVDSCAVAGIVDLLRTKGCFGLSARYAICFGLPTSCIQEDLTTFPSYSQFENLGRVFEEALGEILEKNSFAEIEAGLDHRRALAQSVCSKLDLPEHTSLIEPLLPFLSDSEEGSNLMAFTVATISAFFDNDLFKTTKTFLKNAKGSFGLCVTSSLDAARQICLAARGQTMSIAFFPSKGLICYGSEQAAVKAGLDAVFPGSDPDVLGRSQGDLDNDSLRIDLDDLGGEIVVLDWSTCASPVSPPNRNLPVYEVMNGRVKAVLFQESKSAKQDRELYHRMTRLSRNRFIKKLRPDPEDPVLADILDIPKVCRSIQDDWHSKRGASSLNRLTAFNLSRCLRDRLDAHVAGAVPSLAIDILVTGCEVSLWVAEQFASDLQKSFPMLRVKALSSNKLLGLYGQEIAIPATGFPYSPKTYSLHDSIVIIVSHSGGTFAPLSCSTLLQSATKNIFVVTSEWDTQIGKQLRAMDDRADDHDDQQLFNSRIFSTEVGVRPAEPCSLTVAATHQLLTNLFEYICVVILSDPAYRQVTRAVITEQDLKTLERCNRMNIDALTDIVGATDRGYKMDAEPRALRQLKAAGDLWADHVLENAKAYIMTFLYIFITVVSGYPLFSAIAVGCGLDVSSKWIHLVRVLDAALYFWLPQINITILRVLQSRNLVHRMVGRTVVIGDIPWVAQSAEAFLSKLFACSYSIAGLNVMSGNPVDHFVHRHTHRVVRGSLVICGRPDGRLSALATAEASVCLAVNQASSIQSWGGTCESITIGHNAFKLPLSHQGIFLKRHRPLFFCERMLVENDAKAEKKQSFEEPEPESRFRGPMDLLRCLVGRPTSRLLDSSVHNDSSIKLRSNKRRSAAALFGAYMNMAEESKALLLGISDSTVDEDGATVDRVVAEAIDERKWSDNARNLFQTLNLDGNGFLCEKDFVNGCQQINSNLSEEEAREIFYRYDGNNSGHLDYDEFLDVLRTSDFQTKLKAPPSHKDARGLIQIEASDEKYFGETMRKFNAGKSKKDMDFLLARGQHFSQELYETRIASMQRFVSMCVMFHQLASRVEHFFEKISFGLLGYRIDRTHSIMRIATTASPVGGADVRHRMEHLRLLKKVQHSIHVISVAYRSYRERKEAHLIRELKRQATTHELTSPESGETTTMTTSSTDITTTR